MFQYPRTIFCAMQTVLQRKMYLIFFFPISLVLLVFFVAIPTFTIPSNTFQFQLSLYTTVEYITLVLLAVFSSLFILMNVYTYKKYSRARMRIVVKGGIGSIPGTFASIFGVASCPMCVASLFGFLGFGTVGFLVRYQWWVFFIALAFMLFSLYLTSKKVIGVCNNCK
jgi:hypothetical protein